mmetsp:Transcript_38591/g.57370  ORF Transcript_38591/g.57370 Transcript_38591/m.57370 type:complete len:200 (-) Transcript_38591:878-1477(-)
MSRPVRMVTSLTFASATLPSLFLEFVRQGERFCTFNLPFCGFFVPGALIEYRPITVVPLMIPTPAVETRYSVQTKEEPHLLAHEMTFLPAYHANGFLDTRRIARSTPTRQSMMTTFQANTTHHTLRKRTIVRTVSIDVPGDATFEANSGFGASPKIMARQSTQRARFGSSWVGTTTFHVPNLTTAKALGADIFVPVPRR